MYKCKDCGNVQYVGGTCKECGTKNLEPAYHSLREGFLEKLRGITTYSGRMFRCRDCSCYQYIFGKCLNCQSKNLEAA